MKTHSKVGIVTLVVLFVALFLAWFKGSDKTFNRIGISHFRVAAPSPSQTNQNAVALSRSPGNAISATNSLLNNTPSSQASSSASSGADGQISDSALKQIAALEKVKEGRTPTQQKIDTQLLYADTMRQGVPIADGVPVQRVDLDKDAQGRILVDIKANVTDALLQYIKTLGGSVVNDYPQYQAIRAGMPLATIEDLAGRGEVKFVEPAVRANNNAVDSEGDYTHQALNARMNFGVNGSGMKIGVLSDSVDYLTTSQIAGKVTVLPGQSGTGGTGEGEGTAMLEIVNDLAPGAQLYFATGGASVASFANNILSLQAAGCNIIVDDEEYNNEPPFQDGTIAQAVNTVTASGVMYFSSANNAGNEDDGTSGTWEGDFADGGQTTSPYETGRIHSFGSANYDTCMGFGPGGNLLRVDLFWADPLGASTNDYDLYVLNSSGTTVVASSLNTQSGTQDPYEAVGTLTNGERIAIVKYAGVGRFLNLTTGRGLLSISTQGSTRGHDCATNAFDVAAVNAYVPHAGSPNPYGPYPNPFTGGSANPVETYSSDGYRRVFYQANGSPITPGNFSSTGGNVRHKPDVSAADGVTTDVPGFAPFYGTSAAAPHTAAIAALLKSYNTNLTVAQIRTVLTNTALDIMSSGADRDSGAGIVMALAALEATPLPNLTVFSNNLSSLNIHTGDVVTASVTITNEPCSNGGTSAGAFHVGFYFSSSSTFSGVTPFYEAAVNGCAANGTTLLNQNITISAGTAPGTYYLGYKINDSSEVNECNNGDNGIYYWTVSVLPPSQPDLTRSTDNIGNSTPHPGDIITTSITVTNESCTGGSANAGIFHLGFYGLSSTTSFTGLTPFYELQVNGCAANGTVTTNLNIIISAATPPGNYYLGYKINDESEVAECNTANNGIDYWAITVLPTNNTAPVFGGVSISSGKMIATLSGLTAGENVVLQGSTNLLNWTPLKTNPVSGTALSITNTINPAVKSQFYRATLQ